MTAAQDAPAGPVLGGIEMSELDLETLWPTVPADAKPGDDGLINELSVPQRLALPAAFHRPVWDDLGRPHLWHCAVCWGDGWTTQWPCEVARRDGGPVVLDPRGLSSAHEEGERKGAEKERERILAELAAHADSARRARDAARLDAPHEAAKLHRKARGYHQAAERVQEVSP